MTFTARPAKRERTPVVAGIAGPTKSGKTFSAHRLARGLAQGGPVVMINAEGARGNQYADSFDYLIIDISSPYTPARYTEALKAALEAKPAVVIIDSMSHMHDGPGGLLEYHDAELDRMAGDDFRKRQKMTWTAWIKPKAEENKFVYAMLEADCHFVLCFRAKEKLKILAGKEPIDLGWQPIASDRVAFETAFTLMLPPHAKGVPDMELSEMREPFDAIVGGRQVTEEMGASLAGWAAGTVTPVGAAVEAPSTGTAGLETAPQDDPVERAGRRVPPQEFVAGPAAGKTIAEIYELGDDGPRWIKWALLQDGWSQDFRADLETFANAKLGTAAAA